MPASATRATAMPVRFGPPGRSPSNLCDTRPLRGRLGWRLDGAQMGHRMPKVFGGIEAGGTKFLCAVGSGPDDVVAQERIPTTTPPDTIGNAIAFFRKQEAELGRVAALGIGSFGPGDLDPQRS